MQESIIKLVGITKVFPEVVANDNINLEIKKGEIHAIVGENGAGKSTLMKIIYGLYQPTAGQIYINGRPLNVTNPQIAIKNGIGMVHQHFMLVPSFTVAENVVLGSEPDGILNDPCGSSIGGQYYIGVLCVEGLHTDLIFYNFIILLLKFDV